MDLSKMRARMKVRKVAGQQVARQDRTSKAFAKAQAEAKGAPYAGESGIDVEGNKPRPRLDRPARASGGRVCKADGGPTISEDSKAKAAKLRAEAKKDRSDAIFHGGMAGLVGSMAKGSKVGKALAGINAAGAGLSGVSALVNKHEAGRIESGVAEDGKEDRKRGGRVSKSEDC